MTVGKDVAMLFTDVINCIQTGKRGGGGGHTIEDARVWAGFLAVLVAARIFCGRLGNSPGMVFLSEEIYLLVSLASLACVSCACVLLFVGDSFVCFGGHLPEHTVS